ncbi:hypothetical protein [uncultured Amnibacterium sp.]|uniref:hypothetical protein n=1 Tax=uncultured Amnibacterium sp. TaxID=1631851 RepID=UPI0035CC9822
MGPNFVPVRADDSKPFGAYYIYSPNEEDRMKYSRDIMIEVDKAGTYKPGEYVNVQGAKAKTYARYEIIVKNNTKVTLTPSSFEITAQDGDTDAGRLTDSKTADTPSSPIRPGRSLRWFVVFGNDAGSPAVSINPTIPDESGTYDFTLLGVGTYSD